MAASRISVLGISGSLRKKSFNRALLRAAAEVLPEGMELTHFDLDEIPLYNQDVYDAGMPAAVQAFRGQIAAADALLISSPEYNFSISGVLKNAIDWASRPPNQPLDGKPLGIMGCTPGGLGTVRAQMALRQVCVFVNLLPLNRPELFVSAAHTKFDGEGRLVDGETRQKLQEYLAALAAWTRRLRGH